MRIAALGLAISLLGLACSSPSHAPIAPAPPAPAPPPAAPPVAVPEPPPPAPPALRLPGDVRPARYALELTVIPDRERATGRIAIEAQVVRPTRVVWLNATDLTIDRA